MFTKSQDTKILQLIIPILEDLHLWGKSYVQNLLKPGMYEVLRYESVLEILDPKGKEAVFHKTEVVRFLRDNIIAFQDQAWGDGKILMGYQCSPGVPVDFYRAGHKTHILISLREMKHKGDQLTFNIRWRIRNGFLAPDGYWETDVNHHTHKLQSSVIFPKNRIPKRIMAVDPDLRKSRDLSGDSIVQLSDKRWQVTWEKAYPKLNGQYMLKWRW